MRIIVGRTDRKSVFVVSGIDKVEFNPYWIVPPGILEKDIIPRYKKDKNYLTKNKLEVFTWNNEVVNFPVEPKDLIQYKLLQKPGETNPLGKVKFHFKNENYMFLHDTPNRDLFNNYPSAYSSGCIRIEKPFDLAFFLFNQESNYSIDQILNLFHFNENKIYSLKKPVKIVIDYFTCWANADGEVFFANDFYEYDKLHVFSY